MRKAWNFTMSQQKINNMELAISIIKNPNTEMLIKALKYFNKNMLEGNFPYLMRNDVFDKGEVDTWREEQVSGKSIRLIGVINSKVVSVAYLRRGHGNGFHVATLGVTVDPDFQQKGVANMICKELFNWGREKGIVRVEANPVANNDVAIKFLKKLGFLIEGTASKKFRRDAYNFYDCLHMAIIL